MDEHQIISLNGQVVFYDAAARKWNPAGTSSGLSTVRLIHCLTSNTFRIHARKINDVKEVVLDNQITTDIKYNRPNNDFIQWGDSQTFLGINFRRGTTDGDQFFKAINDIIQILNQGTAQAHSQQQPIAAATLVSQQQQQQQQQQQIQQMQQTSAAIIQRSIQQQMIQQQAPQQPLMHQQQAHLIMQQQQQAQSMLGQAPPTQLLQQQQQQQQNQPMMQQQQLHQHYMQQQPQAQSHPNQTQINHYQHPHQTHLQLQQQQTQQKPPQQQQQSIPPIVAAPIPPPPPPPPPAPPAVALHNQPRINGSSNPNPVNIANNEAQHSPVITHTNNNSSEANGCSPSQASSLANELAKCQLKKVNVSRSDSEKESECNNNNVGNPKTTRAASLAYVQDNLMNDLSKKLASRRERLDQQGDSQANNSNSNITNGTNNDKCHEGWLADLIRKEIGKEMSKMKAEILEAIRSELKH